VAEDGIETDRVQEINGGGMLETIIEVPGKIRTKGMRDKSSGMRFLAIPLLMTLLVTPWSSLLAQSARSLIKEGNRAYEEEDFTGAEVQYRKVLEVDKDLVEGSFNLGDALYRQGNFDGSTRTFEKAAAVSKDDEMAAKAFFNGGNALFKTTDVRSEYPVVYRITENKP